MAGTSSGMCGRSSSGPAAAASLQVVSRASAWTSGTVEGSPASSGRQGGKRAEAAAHVSAEWLVEQAVGRPRPGMPARHQQRVVFRAGGLPVGLPSSLTCLQHEGQRDAHRLPAFASRRQLHICQPQRQASHAPAANVWIHHHPSACLKTGCLQQEEAAVTECGPPGQRNACLPHALLDVIHHPAHSIAEQTAGQGAAQRARTSASCLLVCKHSCLLARTTPWPDSAPVPLHTPALPHLRVITHSCSKCGCSSPQRRPCSRSPMASAAASRTRHCPPPRSTSRARMMAAGGRGAGDRIEDEAGKQYSNATCPVSTRQSNHSTCPDNLQSAPIVNDATARSPTIKVLGDRGLGVIQQRVPDVGHGVPHLLVQKG